MKIFLDTANIESIGYYNDLGLIDGITTNPTLLSKEQGNPEDIMKEITKIVEGPVSLEVISTESENIIKEARILKGYGTNVIVKVPMIPEGLKAVKKLKQEGIDTNVTLVFSANQALLAAKAGALYVSPFIGWQESNGVDCTAFLEDLLLAYRNFGFETEIIGAAIRNGYQIAQAAALGIDIVTCGLQVYKDSFYHPFTDKGLKIFQDAWDQIKDNL